MYISRKPVIHIVNVSTDFCAAGFLRSQSTKEFWRMIQKLWMRVYLGPPDFLAVEQVTGYVSKEIRSNIETAGIQLREVLTENPGIIGVVE